MSLYETLKVFFNPPSELVSGDEEEAGANVEILYWLASDSKADCVETKGTGVNRWRASSRNEQKSVYIM